MSAGEEEMAMTHEDTDPIAVYKTARDDRLRSALTHIGRPGARSKLAAAVAIGVFILTPAFFIINPPPPRTPTPLIIDTDMSFDVDDVGALCMAHAMADEGEVDLLMVAYDAGFPTGADAAGIINRFYGRPNTPVGRYMGEFGTDHSGRWVKGPYVEPLRERFTPPAGMAPIAPWPVPQPPPRAQGAERGAPPTEASEAEEAQVGAEVGENCVDTYRRTLAALPDERQVVIAAIGFCTCLAGLLKSAPDDISPLSGVELVAAKVAKVAYQGGWYAPRHPNNRSTFNWDCGSFVYDSEKGCFGTAQYVVTNMPPSVEQVFNDAGDEVWTGGQLSYCQDKRNPCRWAFEKMLGHGKPRPSWDEVTVLVGVRGDSWLPATFVPGHNEVSYGGANVWSDQTKVGGSKHSYLQLDLEDGTHYTNVRSQLQSEIDRLLCNGPKAKPHDWDQNYAAPPSPPPPLP